MSEIIQLYQDSETLLRSSIEDIRFFSKTEFEIPKLQKKVVEIFEVSKGGKTHIDRRERWEFVQYSH